jgi:hypothetical protein
MEEAGIFYDHLIYLKDIWYNLWPFGIYVGYLVYFLAVLVRVTEKKIWQPCVDVGKCGVL